MSGHIIRCLCGNVYDPERHPACPQCGRPATASPPKAVEPPAPPPPKPAPEPAAPVAIPRWAWKAGAAALVLLLVMFGVKQFPGNGQPEPEPVQTSQPVAAEPTETPAQVAEGCKAIAGDWTWFTGGYVHYAEDGHAFFKPTEDSPPAVTGRWTCDPATGTYTVSWSHGFTDTLKLYDGNEVIQGTNNAGVGVSGKRYVDPAKGMQPLQTTQLGSQQVPSNLPALARAAYRVAADWRPDAYLVSLRIRKDGWPNKDAFYVELSFYSPSESTGLWISSHLTSTKVMKAGTVSWSTRKLPEDFIDLPQAVQAARKAGLRGLIDRAELGTDRRGGREPVPVWDIIPELHGQGAAQIDARSGALVSSQ